MEAGNIHLEIRHGFQQGRQFVLGQAVFFSSLGILKARQGHGHPERGGCKNNNNKIKYWKKKKKSVGAHLVVSRQSASALPASVSPAVNFIILAVFYQ